MFLKREIVKINRMVNLDKIEEIVIDYYLKSSQFNGIPSRRILDSLNIAEDSLLSELKAKIKSKRLCALTTNDDVNPHICRFGFTEITKQLTGLVISDWCCIYPTKEILHLSNKTQKFGELPFTFELATGTPQLAFRHFGLSVLEYYRNDPRYFYNVDDLRGHISIRDEFFNNGRVSEKDEILLKSFGFSRNQHGTRFVTVFLRYLNELSAEHQTLWKVHEHIEEGVQASKEYIDMEINGCWIKAIPIHYAFLLEQFIINEMCVAMNREKLFRQDFGRYCTERPRNFAYLIRPTAREFQHYVLELDKLLSDNINKAFFKDDVSAEEEIPRNDGRIEVRQKGTIQLLNEWVKS